MPSSDWSSETSPVTRSTSSWWLKAAMVLFGSAALLAFVVFANVQAMRNKAWPIVRQLAQRLQTDAGALDLYRANPELGAKYGSEESFLAAVRNYRGQFSSLPVRAPQEGEAYRCAGTPSSFRVWVQGDAGGWMHLFVQGRSIFHQVRGEGLHRLTFAPSREAMTEEDRSLRRARAQADWKRFRDATAQLATEEGSRALFRAEPALAQAYQDEARFLQEISTFRPFLEALPESYTIAGPRLRRRVVRGPQGEERRLAYAFGGGSLTLTWRQERLTEVRFKKGEGL